MSGIIHPPVFFRASELIDTDGSIHEIFFKEGELSSFEALSCRSLKYTHFLLFENLITIILYQFDLFYSMTRKLFSDLSSDQFIREKTREATDEISKIPPENLKETDESELIERIYKKYKLEPLILYKEKVDPARVNHKAKTLEFIIPYTGSADLFNLRPSTFYSPDSVEGILYPSQNLLEISIPASDTNTVILEFNSKCKKIEDHFYDISKQCEEFNSKLKQEIDKSIRKRYGDIKNLEDTAKEVDLLLQGKMKRT